MEKKKSRQPDLTTAIPADLLAPDETITLAIKPSRWLIIYLSFPTIIISAILIAAAFIAPNMIEAELPYPIIIASLLAVILIRLIIAYLQFLARTYILTNQRIITITGLIHIAITHCPLDKIQNTWMTFSLTQRILGIGHIAFATAGTHTAEIVWPYITAPLKLNPQLLAAIKK